MRDVAIIKVGLDGERRVFIQPLEGDFEYVYRAAMEVYWDRHSCRLSHTRPPREWTPIQWFQQIIAAVADEYGALLKLDARTIWTDVPADMQSAMENAG